MTYTNRRTWELPSLAAAGSPLLEVVCERLPYTWGYTLGVGQASLRDPTAPPGSAPRPTAVSFFQTGVRVEFVVSGSVGAFDIFTLGEAGCACR